MGVGNRNGTDNIYFYCTYLSICPLVLSLGEDLKSTTNDMQRQTAGTRVLSLCLFADLEVFAFESASNEAAFQHGPHSLHETESFKLFSRDLKLAANLQFGLRQSAATV